MSAIPLSDLPLDLQEALARGERVSIVLGEQEVAEVSPVRSHDDRLAEAGLLVHRGVPGAPFVFPRLQLPPGVPSAASLLNELRS